jgi:hypothetical protein
VSPVNRRTPGPGYALVGDGVGGPWRRTAVRRSSQHLVGRRHRFGRAHRDPRRRRAAGLLLLQRSGRCPRPSRRRGEPEWPGCARPEREQRGAAGVGAVWSHVGARHGVTRRGDAGRVPHRGTPHGARGGRFLAPPNRYFPELLLEPVEEEHLVAAAPATFRGRMISSLRGWTPSSTAALWTTRPWTTWRSRAPRGRQPAARCSHSVRNPTSRPNGVRRSRTPRNGWPSSFRTPSHAESRSSRGPMAVVRWHKRFRC